MLHVPLLASICLSSVQPALGFHRGTHASSLLLVPGTNTAVTGLASEDATFAGEQDASLLLQPPAAFVWTFVTGFSIFAMFCCLHEWRCARTTALMTDPEDSTRDKGWDVVRFVIVCCIVSTHLDTLLRCEDGYGMWNASNNDALSHIPGKTNLLAECQTPKHTMFIRHSAVYIMPSFAFISGVHGQKADPGTLARLVFCVAGSSLFVGWLVQAAHGFHRPFYWGANWYLWDLLHWRLFLSPLFLAAKSCRVSLALPFGLVAFCTYLMFEGALPALPCMPYLPLFYNPARQNLAPFFALGLLLSPSTWSNLLRNWWLRALAFFALAGWYVAHLSCPSLRSINDVTGFGKVVGNSGIQWAMDNSYWPPPTQTINMTSFLEFLLIFGLKLVIAFAFVWTLAALAPCFHWASLQLSIAVSGFGERALCGYLLHWPLLMVGKRAGVDQLLEAVPENVYLCLNVCLSGLVGSMCCCRLTHDLSHLVTPFWVIDLVLRSKRAIRRLATPPQQPSAGGTTNAEALAKPPLPSG